MKKAKLGIKDKAGVDIFKGDIIQQSETDYDNGEQIDYILTGQAAVIIPVGYVILNPIYQNTKDNVIFKMTNHVNIRSSRAKIIGNIYQNPELLKESI